MGPAADRRRQGRGDRHTGTHHRHDKQPGRHTSGSQRHAAGGSALPGGTGPARSAPARTGSRTPPKGRQPVRVPLPLLAVTGAAVVVVTVVCAVVSYCHIRDLARTAGMGGLAGWLPLGVDGLVVAALVLADRRPAEGPARPRARLGRCRPRACRQPRCQRARRRPRAGAAAGRALDPRRLRPCRSRRLRAPAHADAQRPVVALDRPTPPQKAGGPERQLRPHP